MGCTEKALTALKIYGGAFAIASRAIFSSRDAVFLLSIIAYYTTPWFSDVQPFSFFELWQWFDSLSIEMRAALVGSFVTAIGLYVAFITGYEGYLKQALIELKIKVADELDVLTQDLLGVFSDIEFFASLVTRLPSYQQSENGWDLSFHYEQIQKRISGIEEAKAKAASLNVKLIGLGGSHGLLLAELPQDGKSDFDALERAVAEVIEAQWFYVPTIPVSPQHSLTHNIQYFLANVNFEAVTAYTELAKKQQGIIGGLTGQLRSKLLYPVVGSGFPLAKRLLANGREYFQYSELISTYKKSG